MKKRLLIIISLGIFTLLGIILLLKQTAEKPVHEKIQVSPIENVVPFPADISVVNNQTVIAIDRDTSYLLKISSDKITPVYKVPVGNYSFVYPLVSILELQNSEKVIILDIETEKTSILNLTKFSPIISSSPSHDKNNLYFLGIYSPETRESSLYITPIDKPDPKEIIKTKANSLEVLSPTKIVLFQLIEATDSSIVDVFDLENKKSVASFTGNDYIISPSREKIAVLSSSQFTVFELKSLAKKSVVVTGSVKIAWRDNSVIVILKNTAEGVEISYLDTTSFKLTSYTKIEGLANARIRKISGVVNNTLYAVDNQGKLFKITLP